MTCFYCDWIVRHCADYQARPATFDLGSEAPRCALHWRMRCGCDASEHFMSLAYCDRSRTLFCRGCAAGVREVAADFWGYHYYFAYQSPWSGAWCPALDRLEFEGSDAPASRSTTSRSPASPSAAAPSCRPRAYRPRSGCRGPASSGW